MRRRRIVWILVLLLALAQFVPKGSSNPESDPAEDFFALAEMPQELRDDLQRACIDCHSNDTRWPWYTRLSPVGQWLVHHVDEGRHHLNFSRWGTLSDYRRAKLLAEMDEQVGEGHMPLRSYLWMHGEAKLSGGEREELVQWFRQERARLEETLESPD